MEAQPARNTAIKKRHVKTWVCESPATRATRGDFNVDVLR